jgi:integrase-like protein
MVQHQATSLQSVAERAAGTALTAREAKRTAACADASRRPHAPTRNANCSRTGRPLVHRNVAQRGVEKAASRAGLGKVTPHDLRHSFCSLAGRRGVDPVEAAQITGHSAAVWARFYARSFGKAQRDEARDRLLEYRFGAVSDAQVEGPLAPRSHGSPSDDELSREVDADAQETPANEEVSEGGAYRDRTGELRLASPPDSPTPPDANRRNRRG